MRLLKIRQLWVLTITCFVFVVTARAQYKSYKLTDNRDTINIIDKNGLKQGKWVIHIDEVRGEPGYEEEGKFKDNKKEGIWKMYNLVGDFIGVENYFKGGKDGIQQYYTYLGDLFREESWRAYNPDSPFDTIPIYGTSSNEVVEFRIVKAEPYSVRHGEWKYYEPGSGRIIKSEKYNSGHLEKPNAPAPAVVAKDKKKKPEKTPEMIQWEKKNKGKKKVLRDGRTSGG
jgi:hypothetical protein